ncbi:NUDIX domain-containing protein [Planococcus sp. NCCP-2050]|uniref:NUDIX hydrolase n=1 Tax=Planococcus sp. NCCP-2050 TaxID=2944679 RepID=UPI00203ECEBE|nr:NUDIX domain-containing protein [Planococcus sp. NCCP-2050]GKW46519.1 putative Nudix hydrolase [Planococcus sp. NCCP-2050]
METEKLRVFDEDGNAIGVASREEVHRRGYWHETFHCWMVSRKEGKGFVHLQLRSPLKKDFPNLFDITAAGHLMAEETVEDGIREVEEELGLTVAFEELIPLGIIKDQIHLDGFLDNERCHNFLYRISENPHAVLELQKEEVAGMATVEFTAFAQLCLGERTEVEAKGFEVAEDGEKKPFVTTIRMDNLVPHSTDYLREVVEGISRVL